MSQKLEYILGISTINPTEHAISIDELRSQLDSEFYGMEAQKEEIIRHLASSQFTNEKGTVICLVGPPGTGKTELIRALGKILKMAYTYLPCSGLTTAIDVLGERQVYNAATVGRLVDSFFKVGTTHSIMQLDEFDKMPGLGSASMSKDGNPYNAFLQVFSEKEITDTYLGTEILCPNTIFVCTCNSLDNVPAFIQNRFDVIINVPAYSDEELIAIVNNHIIPKMNKKYNVPENSIVFTDDAVKEVLRFIDDFGARRTGQHIEKIYKEIITKWVKERNVSCIQITAEIVNDILKKTVDMSNVRVIARQHIEDYSPIVLNKIIELEGKLDRPNERISDQQHYQQQLEYFVNLRPDNSPFTFDVDVFLEEANKHLYGMQNEKRLLASLFYEMAIKPSQANKRILFIGPPGVGKTALIQAAATAAKMPYVRISLDGAKDSGYIKGYSGPYQHAVAGIIVREVSKCSSVRALIHLDELDKVANAEAMSALISLTDDSGLFADDFLDGIHLDFRSAIFIATANEYNNISSALLSRFTVINIGNYTRPEQEQILRDYLVPEACEGYENKEVVFDDKTYKALMRYSTSGGVRELKEKATQVIRETVLSKRTENVINIQPEDVQNVLGPLPIERGNRPANNIPGLSNGLAVTAAGSGMCFAIESRLLNGSGIEITGLPSEVIIDSVKIAMGVLAADYEIDFTKKKLHIHFAEGAVKKDGPSAGVSILMSIYSAAIDQPIPSSACYTGEIDLFGYIWAVGGIVEKTEEAALAGIEKVYIPQINYKALSDADRRRLAEMKIKIIPVNHVREIIEDLYKNE